MADVPGSQEDDLEFDFILPTNNEVPISNSNGVPIQVFITVVASLSTSTATVPDSTNGEYNGRSPRRLTLVSLQTMNNQTLTGPLELFLPASTTVTVSTNYKQPPQYYQQQTNNPPSYHTNYHDVQPQQQQLQPQQQQGQVNVHEDGQIEDPYVQRPVNDLHQAPQNSNQGWDYQMNLPDLQSFSTSPMFYGSDNNMQNHQGPMRTENMSTDFRFVPYPNFGVHVAVPDDNETAVHEEKKKTQASATWNMKNLECLRYGVSLLSIMRQWTCAVRDIRHIPTTVRNFLMNGDAEKEERLKNFSFYEAEDSNSDKSVRKCRQGKRNCGQKVCKLLSKFREYFSGKSVESVIMNIHEEEIKIMTYTNKPLLKYPTKYDFNDLKGYLPPNYSVDSWVEFMAKQKNPQKLNQVKAKPNTVE